MKFPTYTDEQFNEALSAQPGTYNFIVSEAEEKISRSGNNMIVITTDIVGAAQKLTVKDWLTLIPLPDKTQYPDEKTLLKKIRGYYFSMRKIKKFCHSINIPYDGEITSSRILNKKGKASFVMGEKNDKGRSYLQVDSYLSESDYEQDSTNNSTTSSPQPGVFEPKNKELDTKFDEDIPF